jgi:hypothetical protein
MKKNSTSQSAFFDRRILIGFLFCLTGVFVALVGFGQSQRDNAHVNRPGTWPALDSSAVPQAIFTVTNTNDSGPGSLRQAIVDANAMPELDTINFNIPSNDPGCNPTTQVCTITLDSLLPFIQTPMTIDGYTQPGAQPNTTRRAGSTLC